MSNAWECLFALLCHFFKVVFEEKGNPVLIYLFPAWLRVFPIGILTLFWVTLPGSEIFQSFYSVERLFYFILHCYWWIPSSKPFFHSTMKHEKAPLCFRVLYFGFDSCLAVNLSFLREIMVKFDVVKISGVCLLHEIIKFTTGFSYSMIVILFLCTACQ